MDWVQCNNCGARPKQAKVFVTTCWHFICEICYKKVVEEACFMCKKKFKAVEICASMRPELLILFHDPKELASSRLKQLNQLITFQSKQRELLEQKRRSKMSAEINRLRKKKAEEDEARKQFEKMKKEYIEMHADLKKMQTEEKGLIEELENLRKHSRKLEKRPVVTKRSRTEPPSQKNPRYKLSEREVPMNTTVFGSGKIETSNIDVLSASVDEAPSRVTSTPISNLASRKEFMNRMFSTGYDPSPIFNK